MNTLTIAGQQAFQSFAGVGDRNLFPQSGQTLYKDPSQFLVTAQIYEIGKQIGKAIASLESQKELLGSSNKMLENDIIQIQMIHKQALNAVVDKWEANEKFTAKKLEIIVEKFKSYSGWTKECGYFPIQTNPLEALIKSIPKLNYESLRVYPEYNDNETDQIDSKEDLPILFGPFIQPFMEKDVQEIASLTEAVSALRITQASLTHKKTVMVGSHTKVMDEIHKVMQEQLNLRGVFDTAHLILESIQWTLPLTSSCSYCLNSNLCTPTRIHFHQLLLRSHQTDLNNLKDEITKIMSSIKKEI